MQLALKFRPSLALLVALSVCTPLAQAASFLKERPAGYQAKLEAEAVRADLQNAMASVLGHGHGVEHDRLLQIRGTISRLFQVLPKNGRGRIERSMLRYALHRYFTQQYSITVKGLEPTLYNASHSAAGAQILLDHVPAYVESVLEGRFGDHGFGLDDLVAIAATLEQLVLGSSTGSLEKAYQLTNTKTNSLLNRKDLELVIDAFVLQWLVGESAEIDPVALLDNRAYIEEAMPQWGEVTGFARGEVDRILHSRRTMGNPFSSHFSFSDAQAIVKVITSGFGHWWETECQGIKNNLTKEDAYNSGRVPLSSFYRRALEGEWRF